MRLALFALVLVLAGCGGVGPAEDLFKDGEQCGATWCAPPFACQFPDFTSTEPVCELPPQSTCAPPCAQVTCEGVLCAPGEICGTNIAGKIGCVHPA